ncbi:hypothetical protein AB0F49_30265 [Micromonospora ureilytica]
MAALIATLFHRRVRVATAWQAMRWLGYAAQMPIRRAAEGDERAHRFEAAVSMAAAKMSPPERLLRRRVSMAFWASADGRWISPYGQGRAGRATCGVPKPR